ncbi:MAG: hypothetical protein SangKO_091140 [Sandaracinaceae bacterium]
MLIPLLFSLVACGGGEAGVVRPAEASVLGVESDNLVPLPDGRLIVEIDARLSLLDPRRPDQEPIVIGPAADVGEVHAAVPTRGAILVLASGGTFILRDAAWVPSPLAESLDGPILDAVLLPTRTGRGLGDLWIATARSLYRVVEDADGPRAMRLALEDDLTMAELAIAPRPEGPALWVRLPDRVLEVWRDRTGVVRSASLVLPSPPTAIGGDASLTGWLVLDGRLYSMGADRALRDRGLSVERLLTSPLSHESWIWTDAGLYLHSQGRLHAVDGVDVAASDRAALGPSGALFAVSAAGVRRFAPRRDVRVEGPADASLLVTPRDFVILAEGSPEVEASVDGQPLEVLTDPLRVSVNPGELGDGSYVLDLRVSYDDGTLPVEERRSFEVVTNATWSEDVQPLYQGYCASCHGPEGPANTRLDAPSHWQDIYELILTNVVEGRMPLGRPPLSQREVALIEAWRVAGYPE